MACQLYSLRLTDGGRGRIVAGMKPHKAFAKWLTARGIPQAEAARVLGVSPPAFHAWVHGRKTPSHPHRDAIQRWTGGAVMALQWASPDELAELQRLAWIKPWAKP